MSRVFIAGLGAVSPAGWGVDPLCEVLRKAQSLPTQTMERPGWEQPLRARLVPNLATRPNFLAHPRLRRASPISHYAAAAALEAAAKLQARLCTGFRLGLVVCLQGGCVTYSRRFLQQTIEDPSLASPLLFPETVYAGPASHVAAVLANVSVTYTLVGDPACFLQGVSMGAQWLEENRIDACVVIGCEESDWILADALWHLNRAATLACGAGAVCLSRDLELSVGVELAVVTDSQAYSACRSRTRAARAMRCQLDGNSPGELLCDGLGAGQRADAAERGAWQDWPGARLSPKKILGEGLMAGSAWQCIVACEAIASGRFRAANVSLVGSNQQAIGARFVRAEPGALALSAGVCPVELKSIA